jgi:formylglycine-generating enzyme required for sulfatase activity
MHPSQSSKNGSVGTAKSNAFEPKMVYVPAGPFWMGSSEDHVMMLVQKKIGRMNGMKTDTSV